MAMAKTARTDGLTPLCTDSLEEYLDDLVALLKLCWRDIRPEQIVKAGAKVHELKPPFMVVRAETFKSSRQRNHSEIGIGLHVFLSEDGGDKVATQAHQIYSLIHGSARWHQEPSMERGDYTDGINAVDYELTWGITLSDDPPACIIPPNPVPLTRIEIDYQDERGESLGDQTTQGLGFLDADIDESDTTIRLRIFDIWDNPADSDAQLRRRLEQVRVGHLLRIDDEFVTVAVAPDPPDLTLGVRRGRMGTAPATHKSERDADYPQAVVALVKNLSPPWNGPPAGYR